MLTGKFVPEYSIYGKIINIDWLIDGLIDWVNILWMNERMNEWMPECVGTGPPHRRLHVIGLDATPRAPLCRTGEKPPGFELESAK